LRKETAATKLKAKSGKKYHLHNHRFELRLGKPPSVQSATESEGCRAEATGEGGQNRLQRIEATARHAVRFYYTYILESRKSKIRYYVGFTEDLESRLESHNSGKNPHTAIYKPWRIKTAVAFTDRQKALDFEAYLKSPSGRAFAKKRL